MLDEATVQALALEVQDRGLAPVARELGVVSSTLASVLARVARPGTEALLASRVKARAAAASPAASKGQGQP